MLPLTIRHVPRADRGAAPTLLVVIDTEEEFDWDAPFDRASRSVQNIRHQILAQALFDAHGIVPTYVVDYPVAASAEASGLLRPWLEAGRAEIGAHLHPWVNPPDEETVCARHSFACNLPLDLQRRKLEVLRDTIDERFGRAPTVYKAGRYGIGPGTEAMLAELGFTADTSVVPQVDFSALGGPDFRGLPDRPFVAGHGIVEVPLSTHFAGVLARGGRRLFPLAERFRWLRVPGILARLGLLERLRLSPEGHGLAAMVRQTRQAIARGERHFVLTYHSSSLMVGGSPYSRSEEARDRLVASLAGFLEFFAGLAGWSTTTVSRLAAKVRAGAPV